MIEAGGGEGQKELRDDFLRETIIFVERLVLLPPCLRLLQERAQYHIGTLVALLSCALYLVAVKLMQDAYAGGPWRSRLLRRFLAPKTLCL